MNVTAGSDLATDRCRLDLLADGAEQEVARLYADRDVRRFLGGSLRGGAFQQRFRELRDDPATVCWAFRLRATSAFVGLVTLGPHHEDPDQELSFQLLPEFWGQGYAMEAASASIRYAADGMGLTSLVAETQVANRRSRALLERLGMQPARTLRRFGEHQVLYRRHLSSSHAANAALRRS